MTGKKYDKHKIRFDLLEPRFIYAMAEVMTYGAHKYAPNNWQEVDDFSDRYTAALHRHLNAWQRGEECDQESGLQHLAQIAINAMFLFWEEMNEDTNVRRFKSNPVTGDGIPGDSGTSSTKADHEQRATYYGSDGKPKNSAVCRGCGTHLGVGAYNLYYCSRKCESKFFGPDNTA